MEISQFLNMGNNLILTKLMKEQQFDLWDFFNLNTPYDVLFIMHYQSNAFGKPGTYTLLSKVPPKIFLRNVLITDIDALEMQLLYKCSTRPATTSIKPVTTSLKPATTSIKITRPISTSPTQKPFPIQWNDGLGYSWATKIVILHQMFLSTRQFYPICVRSSVGNTRLHSLFIVEWCLLFEKECGCH